MEIGGLLPAARITHFPSFEYILPFNGNTLKFAPRKENNRPDGIIFF